MADAEMFAMPFVAVSVGKFLGISELATCERARVFVPDVLEQLWSEAASECVGATPLLRYCSCFNCNPFARKGLRGKQLIAEMEAYRRTVLPSDELKPWVSQTSDNSIQIRPQAFQSEPDTRENGLGTAAPVKLDEASIPFAVGAYRQQSLVVGMKFMATGPVGKNLCIGIQSTSCCVCGQTMSVLFSPFSGSCFIDHNGNIEEMQALPASPSAAVSVRAWIHLMEDGGMRFLRQFDGNELEDAGTIPSERLLQYQEVHCYFPIISLRLRELESDADVSVDYSRDSFPSGMSVPTAWPLLWPMPKP